MIRMACLSILFSFNLVWASNHSLVIDRQDEVYGVKLTSGKADSVRHYQAEATHTFQYPLELIKQSITNFSERCNDAFKSKRLYTDPNTNCKYHHEQMIETFVVNDINLTGWTKAEGEIQRFLLGRTTYNRGYFEYYELIQLIAGKNTEGQKTLTIIQTMLDDEEVKIYTEAKFKRDSAFDKTVRHYTLVETSPHTTEYHYQYQGETSHWILNKQLAVPQVFTAISQGSHGIVNNILLNSRQQRDLASRR